jgi:hypothetical protein
MTVDNKDNYTDENNAGTKLSSPNHQVGTPSKPLPTNDYGFSIESYSSESYWTSTIGGDGLNTDVLGFGPEENAPGISLFLMSNAKDGARVRCIQDAPAP